MISNAIDSAVGRIDFAPVMEKKVYLDTEAVVDATDNKYLTKTLRQHLAACGGILCDQREDSDYVVEVRAGAIGTDRDDMLIGIPATTLPSLPGLGTAAGTIPEIPFIKRTKQRGVVKLAVFAYNRHTGRPLWASGNRQSESSARNLWFAGTGPLTKGSIFNEPSFAGHPLPQSVQSKRERRQETFADHVVLFQEPENAKPLKTPEKSKESGSGEAQLATSKPAAPPSYVYPGPPPSSDSLPPDRAADGVPAFDPFPRR